MDKRYMALGTSMLVLKLLAQESMYGYQIIRQLEQQSQNVFRLQEGTLYPVLHTLEHQGAVTSFQQTAENGRLRKYYQITEQGKRLLNEKLQEWQTYETAVNQIMGQALPAAGGVAFE
ncbi:MAG TPA: helix-turn-helix transcriptional regulator [Candidatus Ventrimonas merdavium]|nr:helix-turn-helix transcriptional regulator [Candidatus Ventrimonas merdavium]